MNKSDREICAAATDGPWMQALEDKRFVYAIGPKGTNKFWFRIDKAGEEKISDKEANCNGDYIARFNPQKVTKMLDDLEAKDKRIEELEKVMQLCAGYLNLDDAHENYAFEQVKELLT